VKLSDRAMSVHPIRARPSAKRGGSVEAQAIYHREADGRAESTGHGGVRLFNSEPDRVGGDGNKAACLRVIATHGLKDEDAGPHTCRQLLPEVSAGQTWPDVRRGQRLRVCGPAQQIEKTGCAETVAPSPRRQPVT